MNSDFNVAVHALVYLDHKHTWLSSEELANNICTNPARVRKVLGGLKRAGIISTREGINGGYMLAKPAEKISLKEVGEIIGTNFVKSGWRSGDPDMECLVASGIADVMEVIYGELDGLCKIRLSTISVFDIEQRLFGAR